MWPWDWISAAGSAISGLTQSAVNWVNSLISSMMSWVSGAVDSIWHAITSTWHDITQVYDWVIKNLNSLADGIYHWFDHLIHVVSDWVLGMVNQLWSYATGVYNWALNEINKIWGYVYKLSADLYGWVIRNVWQPLNDLYNGIRAWVVQSFNQVWQYIEHPELLINLIGAYLLKMWLQYITRFGTIIVRWILQKMLGMAGLVFDVLEHVLTSIL